MHLSRDLARPANRVADRAGHARTVPDSFGQGNSMPISRRCRKAWIALAAGVLLALCAGALQAAEKVVVAVTAIDQHPALNACRDGIRDALKAAGYADGKNLKFVYESAKGDPATALAIARRFNQAKPNVIVPISTPSAQAVVSATIGIPVVFAAVTDPLGAKLVRDMHKPGGNVTGISDLSPVRTHIDLIMHITPGARTIGVLFNPKEANSYTLVQLMKKAAMSVHMTVVEAPAAKPADVAAAAEGLVGKADVIFVPTDNTIVPMIDAVVKVGVENHVPVYAGDIDSVKHGAVAAISLDYYNLGWQTGNVVVRILKGEKPGAIPVVVAEKTKLYVNPGAAEAMGITIPQDVLSVADQVVR
jgi:putative tryptophan/tyrosine transport system substrate-binding protein